MIEVLAIAAGIAAGAAAAGWVRKRLARKPDAVPEKTRSGPIELGDVVVLDQGRGQELWLARALSLVEGQGDPFLVVYECDGPIGARAVIAFDPRESGEIAILRPRAATTSFSRAPQTLELDVDGEPTRLSIEGRRTATGEVKEAEGVEGDGDLPKQGELHVATYRGGAHAYALLVATAGGSENPRLYVGRATPLRALSILPG